MSTLKNVEKLGRQAWLASLGAYGSGWKYAVEKFDQTYAKTNAMVEDFISEGEKIELELREKLKARELLEAKSDELKEKLGLNDPSEEARLNELTAKVDALTVAVAKLVESRRADKAAKVTKPVAKKAAANETKSAAKKTTNHETKPAANKAAAQETKAE